MRASIHVDKDARIALRSRDEAIVVLC